MLGSLFCLFLFKRSLKSQVPPPFSSSRTGAPGVPGMGLSLSGFISSKNIVSTKFTSSWLKGLWLVGILTGLLLDRKSTRLNSSHRR